MGNRSFVLLLSLLSVVLLVEAQPWHLRLETTTVQTSAPIKANSEYMFRYDDQSSVKEPLPIYSSALSDGRVVIGYADTSGNVNVLTVSNKDYTTVQSKLTVAGKEIRGLDAQDDGNIAVLVRRGNGCASCSPPGPCPSCDGLYFVRWLNGAKKVDRQIDDRIYDFSLGTGRLVRGKNNGSVWYRAYYKVHAITTMCTNLQPGHEGDTMKSFGPDGPVGTTWNATDSNLGPGGWCWGCSHSMDERLAWNEATQTFGSLCVSDAFPKTGLFFDASSKTTLSLFPGWENGYVDGGLGNLLPNGVAGWITSFCAPNSAANKTYANDTTDIGIIRLFPNGTVNGSVTWFTKTLGTYEEAAHIIPFHGNYLISWWTVDKQYVTCNPCGTGSPSGSIQSPQNRYLAEISGNDFSIINGPFNITKNVTFDERSDWFSLPGGHAGFVHTWSNDAKLGTPSILYTAPLSQLYIVRVLAPTCSDGLWNGDELNIDCGGPCPTCTHCLNRVKDGDELGVDCGGPTCLPCPSCRDLIQNQNETGVDCGGPYCPPCGATCSDQIKNNNETGIDCGGMYCAPCPTCNDSRLNGDELGVDCGGSCKVCASNCFTFSGGTVMTSAMGKYWRDATDVNAHPAYTIEGGRWHIYLNGATQWVIDGDYNPSGYNGYIFEGADDPVKTKGNWSFLSNGSFVSDPKAKRTDCYPATCYDKVKNGNEKGIDCGGSCGSCGNCTDKLWSGDEAGVDCGGSCAPCAALCWDKKQNGDESGVDCGGASCLPCTNGGKCRTGTDCYSSICESIPSFKASYCVGNCSQAAGSLTCPTGAVSYNCGLRPPPIICAINAAATHYAPTTPLATALLAALLAAWGFLW